jgi:hypothetical protein
MSCIHAQRMQSLCYQSPLRYAHNVTTSHACVRQVLAHAPDPIESLRITTSVELNVPSSTASARATADAVAMVARRMSDLTEECDDMSAERTAALVASAGQSGEAVVQRALKNDVIQASLRKLLLPSVRPLLCPRPVSH